LFWLDTWLIGGVIKPRRHALFTHAVDAGGQHVLCTAGWPYQGSGPPPHGCRRLGARRACARFPLGRG
jgi:hypothetical protein